MMQSLSYNCLVLEFLSSLSVNWDGTYRGWEVEISFRMFNIDHQMSLRMVNKLLKLLAVKCAYRDVPML